MTRVTRVWPNGRRLSASGSGSFARLAVAGLIALAAGDLPARAQNPSAGPPAASGPTASGAPTPGTSGAKRPFTIEDLYRVKLPSGIALSPDGKHLVYSLQDRDFGRGKEFRDLWRIGTDGGGPQRMTFTEKAAEYAPAYSPDGRSIAFVAKRGEKPGLWLLPSFGGEARLLLEWPTGIADPAWSPDGRHIAFISEVYPACGADAACNQRLDDQRDKGPLKAYVADELMYRHWNAWNTGKVTHLLLVEVATGKVRDMTPGEREAPVFSLGKGIVSFSPDGRQLAYTSNPDPREDWARSTNSDVYIVPVEPGPDGKTQSATNITADNKAWDGDPAWSPDGRFIAYRRQLQPGYESDLFSLVVYDVASGRRRVLSEKFDNWITALSWLQDSSAIVFKADVEAQTPLYRVPVGGGAPVKVATFAQIDETVLSRDGRYAYVVRRSIAMPHEIWRLDLTGAAPPLRLTRHNEPLERDVDLRPVEMVWVDGAKGAKIHTLIVKPPGFDPAKKYPVIVNIHGGPQMQWADAFRGDWQILPGAGYVEVFPNPHGSTGYGQAFTAQISGDWTGAVIKDIHEVTDWIEKQPWADKDRIGAMGWSWGGFAVNWLQGTTKRYKALASMMGLMDLPSKYGATEELWFPEWDLKGTPWTSSLYETQNPARNVKNFSTPQLVVTGELDYRVVYTQGLMTFTYLRRMGVPAKLVVFPNAGHWPSWYEMALYYTAHLEWFHKYLGGAPPPWSSEDFAANRVFDPETGQRR